MTSLTLKWILALLLWGGAIIGSLQIAHIRGDWGINICGMWGCGAPVQALVACHLTWSLVLAPLSWGIQLWRKVSPVWMAGLTSLFSAGLVLAFCQREYAEWWNALGANSESIYWQRVGFVIATTVEIPTIGMLVVSLAWWGVVAVSAMRGRIPARINDDQQPELPFNNQLRSP